MDANRAEPCHNWPLAATPGHCQSPVHGTGGTD
jgi:hypothetical protein